MSIPKYPHIPNLTDNQIKELTKIVFCEDVDLGASDVIFVFGSTHPATYQNALEIYKKGIGKEIIISGGPSGSKDKHKDWLYGEKSEARVIYEKLALNGVPVEKMFFEESSRNSKENILFAKEIYDFSKIKSIVFIGKNYAAGRQCRTLKKHLFPEIKLQPYPYKTYLDEKITFCRYDWMNYAKSRSLVLGEYLRIVFYGLRGDIEAPKGIVKGLKSYVEGFIAGV